MKKGVAVTGKGNLICKKCLIHMETPETKKPELWKSAVTRVLDEAEKHQLNSISFPAIGTGI